LKVDGLEIRGLIVSLNTEAFSPRVDGEQMKVRDLIKRIEKDGWQYMYTTGSHRHFKHPEKPGKVTVP
jgi:hypothetical protein